MKLRDLQYQNLDIAVLPGHEFPVFDINDLAAFNYEHQYLVAKISLQLPWVCQYICQAKFIESNGGNIQEIILIPDGLRLFYDYSKATFKFILFGKEVNEKSLRACLSD